MWFANCSGFETTWPYLKNFGIWFIFLDETRICMVQVVMCLDGEQELSLLMPVPVPFAGWGVMFWAGIMANDRTLWWAAVREPFVFINDNAQPHRTRAVNRYLENEGINRLDWPAVSPDINPIEHAWYMIGRAVASRANPPKSIHELVLACTWTGSRFLPTPILALSLETFCDLTLKSLVWPRLWMLFLLIWCLSFQNLFYVLYFLMFLVCWDLSALGTIRLCSYTCLLIFLFAWPM